MAASRLAWLAYEYQLHHISCARPGFSLIRDIVLNRYGEDGTGEAGTLHQAVGVGLQELRWPSLRFMEGP
jgi:hypothetical protein